MELNRMRPYSRCVVALLLVFAVMLSGSIITAFAYEPTCRCGTTTGVHAKDCSLYVAPPACTCGSTTADVHSADCPQYVAPLTCICGTTTNIHAEGCVSYVAPACTCGTTTDTHAKDCSLYTASYNLSKAGEENALPKFTIVVGDEIFTAESIANNKNATGYGTYVQKLISADMALLRAEAMGGSVYASFQKNDETPITGFDAVCNAVYDLLLQVEPKATYTNGKTLSASNSTGIIRISGTVKLSSTWKVSGSSKVLFIAEEAATIQIIQENEQKYGQFNLIANEANTNAALVIHGRSNTAKITVEQDPSQTTGRTKNVFHVQGNNLYLQNVHITGFDMTGGDYVSTIRLQEPSGSRTGAKRFLYMSHSTMSNIQGGEAPGIFCGVYSEKATSYAKGSAVYLYDCTFTNCVTTDGTKGTFGGSAIRSYAADECVLTATECKFLYNKVGTSETAESGKATGGGAIYWKSLVGKAILTNCTFTGNSSTTTGGAIYNMGNMEIYGCTFTGNTTKGNGGAIAAETPYTTENYNSIQNVKDGLKGSLTLDSATVIQNNKADGSGGGIYFYPVSASIGNRKIEKFEMEINVKGATIQNNTAKNGGALAMYLNYDSNNYTAKINIDSGSITGNTATENGGAIWMDGAKNCACKAEPSVNMKGGTIAGNQAENGGAIYLSTNNQTSEKQNAINFNMSGGTLGIRTDKFEDKNRATNGGGIYLNGGSLTMSGGTILNNNASESGGGAYITGGDFTLDGTDAKVQGNEAKNGAGIYLTGGTPNLKEGSLEKNTAAENGGGIYINQRKVNLSPTGDVAITENTAKQGGGIYISGTNGEDAGFQVANDAKGMVALRKNGDATKTEYGGAVCINNGYFIMDSEKLTIAQNEAINGGGVAVLGGDFTMSSGIIGGEKNTNKATNGGGFYVSNGKVTMRDGMVSHNEAEKGAGIYLTGGSLEMTGGIIATNKATEFGGGAYITGGDYTLEGKDAKVQGNEARNGAGIYLDGGKPLLKQGALENNTASEYGGGIFINKQIVEMSPTGAVNITANMAKQGGGIYISGTSGKDAGFHVQQNAAAMTTLSGNGNVATTEYGGAVCINNGFFRADSDKVSITQNKAVYGGGVAVLGGDFTMTGHDSDGGYVGGEVSGNSAKSGGGAYVANGNVYLSGGKLNSNKATAGSGGAVFVQSSSQVAVKIYSGELNGNSATASGGAVAINGNGGSIQVQIGVNAEHNVGENTYDGGITYTHGENCPKITNNIAADSGGAFHITGAETANLSVYCLEESGNSAKGDIDINKVTLSDFMMVQGGKVIISSADHSKDPPDGVGFGKSTINGSIHMLGGTLDLYGSMTNPKFNKYITIDLEKGRENDFTDHRLSDGYVKLAYYENFPGTSTYTADDVQSGVAYTVLNNLYSHPGYTMKGWYTNPDGTGTKYEAGTDYIFATESHINPPEGSIIVNNLTLYAYWEANGYDVIYDPNSDSYSGQMPTQSFTYDVETPLAINQYIITGKKFSHWVLDGETYQDGQKVKNLTDIPGGKVILKAQWTDCDHADCRYEATEFDEAAPYEAVLSQICNICTYTRTATMVASDTVYDGQPHPVAVTYSDSEWQPEVEYAGTKFPNTEDTEGEEGTEVTAEPIAQKDLTIGAGKYIATITVENVTAKVTYTIEKADQPAPTQAPSYQEPEEGKSKLYITPIDAETSPVTQLPAEYFIRYAKDDEMVEVKIAEKEDGKYVQELTEAMVFYFVGVRYIGDDNYNPSQDVTADRTFLYKGNITLTIKGSEGINIIAQQKDKGIVVDTTVLNGYYLVDEKFVAEVEPSTTDRITVTEDLNNKDKGKFTISGTSGDAISVTVTFKGARKAAEITGNIAAGERFDNFSNTAAVTVSSDSAYTVSYYVTGYDVGTYKDGENETEKRYYGEPILRFSKALPEKTHIILLDKSNNTYWYYTGGGPDIPLTYFRKMEDGNGRPETESIAGQQYVDLNLQFVVIFEDAGMSAGNLETKLVLPGSEEKKCPNIFNEDTLTANLQDTGFGITLNGNTVQYSGPAISASRWDHRGLALVLKPQTGEGLSAVPADARILRTIAGDTKVCWQNEQGHFIIPLAGLSGEVDLRLESDLFPAGADNKYAMQIELKGVQSLALTSPMNGDLLHKLSANIEFTHRKDKEAVQISVANDQRLFGSNSSVTATVNASYVDGHNLVVELRQKDQYGAYISTGFPYNQSGDNYTFVLNKAAQGSYCIVASIKEQGGYVIHEAPYYFVIQ